MAKRKTIPKQAYIDAAEERYEDRGAWAHFVLASDPSITRRNTGKLAPPGRNFWKGYAGAWLEARIFIPDYEAENVLEAQKEAAAAEKWEREKWKDPRWLRKRALMKKRRGR